MPHDFSIWVAEAIAEISNEVFVRVKAAKWRRPVAAAFVFMLLALPLINVIKNFSAMDLSRDTEAVEYGRQLLASVPQDALLVTDGDEHIFSLWYARYVEHPESRVVIIARRLTQYSWYQDQVRRHNPEWVLPDSSFRTGDLFLQMFVARNIARHAVYWTDPDPEFAKRFQFRSEGLLFRVVPNTE